MSSMERIIRERTDVSEADLDRLVDLVDSWSILADLSQADLVLWVPTWNGAGYVAADLIRPMTAPTTLPDEIVGIFAPRGRLHDVDRAMMGGIIGERSSPGAIGVPGEDARIIGVVARHAQTASTGIFQEVYARVASIMFDMVSSGDFPPHGASVDTSAGLAPRVGDGAIAVDSDGRVMRASPNAISAFRRMGLATDLIGADLAHTVVRLLHRPGPVDASVSPLVSGRVAGLTEVEGTQGSLVFSSWPLIDKGERTGALILVRDVTDLRSRDRALLSKEATLREVHHRVKNNLQTVAALLRLQSRRVVAEEAKDALRQAGRRVSAIASVHDMLAVSPGQSIVMDDVLTRLVDLSGQVSSGSGPSIDVHAEVGAIPGDVAGPVAMAVSELLANAVEHAKATKVMVRAGRTDGHALVIDVADDGIGIGEDNVEGLGLQIVRSLIEEDLRGRVTIGNPETGSGTVVSVQVLLD